MEFSFISGHPALDFVGTVRSRRDAPVDLLATPDDLAAWTAESAMLSEPAPTTSADLTRALRLREAIYGLTLDAASERPYGAGDCRLVSHAAAAHSPVRLDIQPDGTVRRTGTIGAVLATLARGAVELVAGTPSGSIKECAAPRCTRLFVDRSHRGARRWCDMARCGNRAKSANFRSRQAD